MTGFASCGTGVSQETAEPFPGYLCASVLVLIRVDPAFCTCAELASLASSGQMHTLLLAVALTTLHLRIGDAFIPKIGLYMAALCW